MRTFWAPTSFLRRNFSSDAFLSAKHLAKFGILQRTFDTQTLRPKALLGANLGVIELFFFKDSFWLVGLMALFGSLTLAQHLESLE